MAGIEGTEQYDATDGLPPQIPPNGKPRPVDVHEIEEAISQLHKEHGDAAARAYILNLLVFTSNRAYLDLAHAIGAQVCRNYPSRAIVMDANPTGDTALAASVVTQQELVDAPNNTASELIVLRAAGEAVGQLPAVVSPLLIPEIPVALCWLGDVPFGLPVFDAIMNTVDQLIVDSSQFSHPIGTVERMHALAADQWTGVTFNDLTWTRLMAWREATAQFFDPPTTRPALEGIQRVSVTFANGHGGASNPAEALLFAGWLGSRLGWEAVRDLRRMGRETILVMRRGEMPIIIECGAESTEAVPNGDLLTVTIKAETADGTMAFHLVHDADQKIFHTTTTHNGQMIDSHTLPSEERGPGDMVCDIVGSVRRDHIYEQSLDLVIRLVGSGLAGR